MAKDILRRLVNNSRMAIDDGTYDVAGERMDKSDKDLQEIIVCNPHPTLLTEIKFASPSQGKIRTAADPASIARQMVSGGASALSVLTQPHLFNGSPEYFMRVRQAVDVPMLMKDIMVDTVQVDAAVRIGADYILLIQSLFEHGHLKEVDEFVGYGHRRGLKVLLEVHTKAEFEAALDTEADLIGINNRNLDTLEIDLGTTERILSGTDAVAASSKHVISESGISTPEEIRYLKKCGASAFLIGSSIMGREDIAGSVRELAGAY